MYANPNGHAPGLVYDEVETNLRPLVALCFAFDTLLVEETLGRQAFDLIFLM